MMLPVVLIERLADRHRTKMNAAPAVHTENSVAPLAGSGGSCRPTTQAVMGSFLLTRRHCPKKKIGTHFCCCSKRLTFIKPMSTAHRTKNTVKGLAAKPPPSSGSFKPPSSNDQTGSRQGLTGRFTTVFRLIASSLSNSQHTASCRTLFIRSPAHTAIHKKLFSLRVRFYRVRFIFVIPHRMTRPSLDNLGCISCYLDRFLVLADLLLADCHRSSMALQRFSFHEFSRAGTGKKGSSTLCASS